VNATLFSDYRLAGYYDEMFDDDAEPRDAYRGLFSGVASLGSDVFTRKTDLAGACYLNEGITFSHHGREHPFPFDLLPRLIRADDACAKLRAQQHLRCLRTLNQCALELRAWVVRCLSHALVRALSSSNQLLNRRTCGRTSASLRKLA